MENIVLLIGAILVFVTACAGARALAGLLDELDAREEIDEHPI